MPVSMNHKKHRPHSKWKKTQNRIKAAYKYANSPKRKKNENEEPPKEDS